MYDKMVTVLISKNMEHGHEMKFWWNKA